MLVSPLRRGSGNSLQCSSKSENTAEWFTNTTLIASASGMGECGFGFFVMISGSRSGWEVLKGGCATTKGVVDCSNFSADV